MHSDIEKLDMWRDTETQCRLGANYVSKKEIIIARYHLETALVQLKYLECEKIEAASGACEEE